MPITTTALQDELKQELVGRSEAGTQILGVALSSRESEDEVASWKLVLLLTPPVTRSGWDAEVTQTLRRAAREAFDAATAEDDQASELYVDVTAPSQGLAIEDVAPLDQPEDEEVAANRPESGEVGRA